MKLLTLASTLVIAAAAVIAADTPKSIYDVSLKDIDGADTSLKPYQGKVMLIVNVASKCGKTPQYAQLEQLNQEYQKDGLAVLGFPCNDFGGQEPGTNGEIKEFCSKKYHVTFPMFDKVKLNGRNAHPLYQELTKTPYDGSDSGKGGKIKWNFEKFVITPAGDIHRFLPTMEPDDAAIVSVIEANLPA